MIATAPTLESALLGGTNYSAISPLLHLLQKCNSFFTQGLTSVQGDCSPLVVAGRQVGIIRPDVARCLMEYPQVFMSTPGALFLNPEFDTYRSRSEAVNAVLQDLRSKNILCALRGWRDECFNVWSDFGQEPLFQIERSAATILGVRAFGVHINGYMRSRDGAVSVWLQKRAANKPTWPGMMDSMVGGGITAGLSPSQVVVKEAAEEASIPPDLITRVQPAGTVSFFTETERGVHANTEFVYDLELPSYFVPTNADGEVEGFELVPTSELLGHVLSTKYKLTSVPVAIDFLIRHGVINSETEPNFPAVQELLHIPLHQFFHVWPLQCLQNPSVTPMPEALASSSCHLSASVPCQTIETET